MAFLGLVMTLNRVTAIDLDCHSHKPTYELILEVDELKFLIDVDFTEMNTVYGSGGFEGEERIIAWAIAKTDFQSERFNLASENGVNFNGTKWR